MVVIRARNGRIVLESRPYLTSYVCPFCRHDGTYYQMASNLPIYEESTIRCHECEAMFSGERNTTYIRDARDDFMEVVHAARLERPRR